MALAPSIRQPPGSETVAAGPGQWVGRLAREATNTTVLWLDSTFVSVGQPGRNVNDVQLTSQNRYIFWAATIVH